MVFRGCCHREKEGSYLVEPVQRGSLAVAGAASDVIESVLQCGIHTKLPAEDGGLVDVPLDPCLDVVLVRSLSAIDGSQYERNPKHKKRQRTHNNFRVGVEVVVGLALAEDLVDVDVHSAVVAPVVCPVRIPTTEDTRITLYVLRHLQGDD